MDDLSSVFQRRLRERVETLTAERDSLDHDPAAAARVRAAAHSLKGSGGTYGFPEISAAAAAVEEAPDADLGTRVEALLAALRSAAEAEPAHDITADLRRALAESVAAPPLSAPGPAGAAGPPSGVLIVDDDPDVTRLLSAVLATSGRTLYATGTAAEAEQVLATHPVGLVVLDVMLPDADGRTVLSKLREDPRTAVVPIVVLSGHASPETRAECFALGADAYIQKPFDPVAVAAAVTSTLSRAVHVPADARLDPVTALPNRAAFRETFQKVAAVRAAGAAPLSLALAELDQYRPLASSSGWGTADRALAAASRSLARALPRARCVARWAGATLAILLTGADEAAATVALTDALRAARREPVDGPAGPYTFSAGVVEWSGGASLEDTLAEAENQMVAARTAGGDTVRSAGQPGPAAARVVLLAEDDDLIVSVIKHRLEREGLTVRHFADGASACEAAPRLRPALAILDVKMPGMDGFEVLRRLRAEPALRHTPVMMLTSMGSEHDVVRGLQLGADDYIVKPFSPVELVARVHRHLLRH